MKKTKKALASLAIMGMAATLVPFNVFAATGVTTARLSGADRFSTAVAIADQFVSATTAILAPGADAHLVDALAAAPLAGTNSPILLTESSVLTAATKAELTKLGVKNVYVVGAIDQTVVDQVSAMGITTTVIKGANRIETAKLITAKLASPAGTFVVGYDGLADALSVASYAAAHNYSILVTNPDGNLPAGTTLAGTKYTVGGTTRVVPIAGVTGLAGSDRYATNKAVLDTLAYTYNRAYVANGTTGHLVDSLVGSSLAAKTLAPIVLIDGNGGDATAVATHAKLADSAIVTALGGIDVVTDATLNKVVTGTIPTQGALSVTSVSAISANSFKVVFNQAVADTSKIAIAVARSTTPVTTTFAWNAANTEVTVMSSANLPEGSYTVAVKNDLTDLGTTTIAITAQKVAKINITSSKLALATDKAGKQTGYASYNVQDQYGNDITSSYLANNVVFQSGVGTVTGKSGVLKIDPTINLIQFASVVITAYDSTTGISTSATLTTSTALGTLSDITLNTLSNTDGRVLTAGDTSTTWYIDYTATDISGNPTKDYNLVKAGLILGDDDTLTTASSYVTAKVVQDPNDSTKAAIEVTVSDVPISMDIPISITAMTYTGKTSTLSTVLKKAAKADTFTLMAPAFDIAVGETKEIPFTAYDQNGVAVTKASELGPDVVTFSPSSYVQIVANVDGTAKLMVGGDAGFATDGPQVITAMTSTGKLSTVTLNIQKVAKADTLALDSSVFVKSMQTNATQAVDFGFDKGGLSAKDQYGRVIDMTGGSNSFTVTTESSNDAIVSANGTSASVGKNQIVITAVAQGTATIKFSLVNELGVAVDTKSITFSVIKNGDIKGYTMDAVTAPIYAGAADIAVPTGRDSAYDANPSVYGTTSSGSKVVLASANVITGAYVDNTTDFAVDLLTLGKTTAGVVIPLGAYDSANVVAKKLDNNRTTASTTLTVTLKGADDMVHTLTTPITSSSVAPAASSLVAKVDTSVLGISLNATGDIANVDLTKTVVLGVDKSLVSNGNFVTRFGTDGTLGTGKRAAIYFYALDQYGTKAMPLAQVLAGDTNVTGFSVSPEGLITAPTFAVGDYITLTGVTTNGLQKTLRINFTDGTSATTVAQGLQAAVTAGNTAVANATTAQAAYITAGGLVGDANYVAITAPKAALVTALAANPKVTATITGATTALNTKVQVLKDDTTAFTAAVTAANVQLGKTVASKAAYLSVGGSALDAVYTNVTAARAALVITLAVNPQVKANVVTDTATLKDAITALDLATAAL